LGIGPIPGVWHCRIDVGHGVVVVCVLVAIVIV
jgi:hypothetical protein